MKLILGDCLLHLRTMSDDTFDSLVTDPPAGIGFMGKEWDDDKGGRKQWIAWMTEVMRECLRVMKPGAHGFVWALPRTSHWTATALEDAGFEVRDVVTHLFGSGFPKSLDVSKAIDKAAGAERTETFVRSDFAAKSNKIPQPDSQCISGEKGQYSLPATDDAKQWQGWGTALKPASEHWILVRKPISEKTVAANVLKWGTGALNIDASRIGTEVRSYEARLTANKNLNDDGWNKIGEAASITTVQGRFPANLVLSHTVYCTDVQCEIGCAVRELDEQSDQLKSGARKRDHKNNSTLTMNGLGGGESIASEGGGESIASEGGASRFFYCAKISKSERNAGLEGMPKRVLAMSGGAAAAAAAARGEEYSGNSGMNKTHHRENHHPTVKPKKLMTYLIRMVTPPGGIVLDPFMGSGSTGVAALEAGFQFVGIERDSEYVEIAKKRIEHVSQ